MLMAIDIKFNDNDVIITSWCPHCHKTYDQSITKGQYDKWQTEGNYIQTVFPDWTAEQRDQLMNGLHVECSEAFYDKMEEAGIE